MKSKLLIQIILFVIITMLTTTGGVASFSLSPGTGTYIYLPLILRIPPNTGGSQISAIAVGSDHTCALTSSGGVKCWGNNNSGQLGDGTYADSNTPVDVVGLGSGVNSISAGAFHTCAVTSGGGLKCWGNNSSGQLGDGTVEPIRNTPVDVVGLGSGVNIAAPGGFHTCALTSSGGVKCWGSNYSGELGDGTNTDRNTPVDVVGLGSGVNSIFAGFYHTCALTSSGGVKCWGWNVFGQVGDGTNTDRNTPVDVVGLGNGVNIVAAGGFHSCALNSIGGIKCWGYNYSGQLGDGTNDARNKPVDVVGIGAGFATTAAGGYHTCALDSSYGVKCWGSNEFGQLGNASNIDSNTPEDVIGLGTEVAAIATGGGHTCALTSIGGVRCWGSNEFGQLGDGTNTDRNTPVDVVGLGG